MFKKSSNIVLGIIFGILAVTVIMVFIFDSGEEVSTFTSDIMNVDSASVNKIEIMPSDTTKTGVTLEKKQDKWYVHYNGELVPASQRSVGGIMDALLTMKAKQLVGKKNQWIEYKVTDTSGTRVAVKGQEGIQTEFIIGKFSYKKPDNPYQRQGTMTSYIRLAGKEEVYAVDGFLTFIFQTEPKSYRDAAITKLQQQAITRVTFTYPEDSSFVVEKVNQQWQINGNPADSIEVTTYLNQIAMVSGQEFLDDVPAEHLTNPAYTLRIEGANMAAPQVVHAFPADSVHQYYITSSINQGACFSGMNIFNRLFPEMPEAMTGGE